VTLSILTSEGDTPPDFILISSQTLLVQPIVNEDLEIELVFRVFKTNYPTYFSLFYWKVAIYAKNEGSVDSENAIDSELLLSAEVSEIYQEFKRLYS
jgi:hypothetical protein